MHQNGDDKLMENTLSDVMADFAVFLEYEGS